MEKFNILTENCENVEVYRDPIHGVTDGKNKYSYRVISRTSGCSFNRLGLVYEKEWYVSGKVL